MTLTILNDGYAILHEQELAGLNAPRYRLLHYRTIGDAGYWETPEQNPPQELLAHAVEVGILTPELQQYLLQYDRLLHTGTWRRYNLRTPVEEWLIGSRFEFEPLSRLSETPLALIEGGYVVVGKRYIDGLQRVKVPYLGRFERGRGKRVQIVIARPQPWDPAPVNPEPIAIHWLYRALHYGKLNAPLRRWIKTAQPAWEPLE